MTLLQLERPEVAQGATGPARGAPAGGPRLGGAGQGIFFLAFNLTNVLNYAFLLAMSRALAPGDFALFASLFGAVYFASALANTTKTSVAVAVATPGSDAAAVVGSASRWLLLMGLPLGGAVLLAARPVAAFLHSDDVASVALAGIAVWLSLLAAVGYGGLLGGRRFILLGAGLLVASAGRLVLGPWLVWMGLGVGGGLLAIVIGLAISAALVLAPFRRAATAAPSGLAAMPPLMPLLPAFVASLATAMPTSADVVLARHYLPTVEAGAYAAVSVLGKIVVFLPMAVSLIVFPAIVREHAAGRPTSGLLRLNLLLAAGLAVPTSGAIIAAGVLFPQVVLRGYDVPAPFLATYVAAMAAYSLVVVLLYAGLARPGRRQIILLALPALAAELAVVALWHPAALAMALTLLVGNTVLLLAGLRLAWGESGEPAGEEPTAPTAAVGAQASLVH